MTATVLINFCTVIQFFFEGIIGTFKIAGSRQRFSANAVILFHVYQLLFRLEITNAIPKVGVRQFRLPEPDVYDTERYTRIGSHPDIFPAVRPMQ